MGIKIEVNEQCLKSKTNKASPKQKIIREFSGKKPST